MLSTCLCRKIFLDHLIRRDIIRRTYSIHTLHNLKRRGIIKEFFPENRDEIHDLFKTQQTVYAGFDPTADSLHIGNLVVLMTLIHLLRDGHKVVCVIGDATASIGDPSGKLSERPLLAPDVIEANCHGIFSDLNKIFSNHLKYFWKPKNKTPLNEPIVLRNNSWYSNKNVIDFISKVGRGIRMQEMLSRRAVKERLESLDGLSFAEFSYQAFQSYDWMYLHDKYGCHFQIGGGDQLGNITSGYQLIRRANKEDPVFGLLTNLVVDQHGNKYGKTAGTPSLTPVWLNRKKLSPFDFYQFFIRLPDVEIGKFLKMFTFISDEEVEHIMQKFLKKPKSRYAHERVAEQLTLLVHGEDGLTMAKKTTKALFDGNLESISSLTLDEMQEIFGTNELTTLFLEPGDTTVLDVAMKAGCFVAERDAIRIMKSGGFHINNERVDAPFAQITETHILPNHTSLLRVGKKRYYIVKWS